MKKIVGVYKIKNIVTGGCYIGSSSDIWTRWRSHKNMLKTNTHGNIHLQRAWNLYKQSSFVFGVIEDNIQIDDIYQKEQHYIDLYVPTYNICKTADGSRLSEETKKKISDFRKVWVLSNPSPFKGRKHTKESREKIKNNHARLSGEKASFYGKHHTTESKRLLSESKKGERNVFFGKKRPDHSAKMSGESHFMYGKKYPPEYGLKLSKAKCILNEDQMREVIEYSKAGFMQKDIAYYFKCSRATIGRIVRGEIKSLPKEA